MQIGDQFFGVIETGYGEVDEFEAAVEALNGGAIRWPGGTLAETRPDVYDLNYPDLFDASTLFEGSSNLIRSGLSDVLSRAVDSGEALTIVLPTLRYAEDLASGATDVANFLDKLLTGNYGQLPRELTLEVGNEYFALEEFSRNPGLYGAIASEFTEIIAAAVEEHATHLFETNVGIAVQIGKEHSDNTAILDAFSAEALLAVDLLAYHFGPINLNNLNKGSSSDDAADQGLGRVARTEEYLAAWYNAIDEAGGNSATVEPYLSAWAIGAPANDPEDVELAFQAYGARGASLGLETMVAALSLGTEQAHVWGVDAPNLSTLIEVEENDGAFSLSASHFGTFFGLAAELLPGHTYAHSYEEKSRTQDGAFHVFTDDGRMVVVGYVNDVDGATGFGVDFAALGITDRPGSDAVVDSGWRIGTEIAPEFMGYANDPIARLFEEPVVSALDPGGFTFGDSSISGFEFTSDYELTFLAISWTYQLSSGDDVYSGTEYDDKISAGLGNDIVDAGNGDDMVSGGNGRDTLDGGAGADTLRGGTQEDILIGGAGNDLLEGGAGFDVLEGRDGDDTLKGGAQADRLEGGQGNDFLEGEGGLDTIFGGVGNDWAFGGAGNDRIFGGTQEDIIDGGAGEDLLYGEAGFDTIFGGDGSDEVYGGAQADRLLGQSGEDIIFGEDGRDRIWGGDDNDTICGGNSDDLVFGELGNDMIHGGEGNDRLYGNAGFDTIEGGAGDDILFGGFNADNFVFKPGDGNDRIGDFDAANLFERIDLSAYGHSVDFLSLIAGSNQTLDGAELALSAHDSILLLGVSLDHLSEGDFIFG